MFKLFTIQGLAPHVLTEGFSAYKATLGVTGNTMITDWSMSSPNFSGNNFNGTTGLYTAPKTGAYQTQAIISYTAGTITSQLGANNPFFLIQRTAPATTDLFTGKLPVSDVDIALVNLRTLLSSSAVTLAGTMQLTQGDILGLFYNADGMTLGLTLEDIYWATYPLG